jgi:hypothetical protein
MEPEHMDYDRRYPYGYVVFEKPGEGAVNLDNLAEDNPNFSHIVRNRNGSFPIPEGWNQ